MNPLRRLYYILAGYLSWVVFGTVGLLLNLVCIFLLILPGRERRGATMRRTIRWLFGTWCAWLHATRLIAITWRGFTPEALAGPAVYIANHPGLLDATFLLSRLPDTICIFKPALTRNPAMGPAAIMAGYASGDTGIDLIRDVTARVAAGRSLLIFPEGTRTLSGGTLNPLRPGFALIATRAHVPVRLISIRPSCSLLPKGTPWWSIPGFPADIEITLLGELSTAGGANATELTSRATQRFLAALAAP